MLSFNATISGDKILIEGLNGLAAEMPRAVQRGLKRVVIGIHREAMANLNGPGGLNSYQTRTSKSGKQYQKKTGTKMEMYDGFTRASGEVQQFKRFTDSGGYPVPFRTGNLKRLLDFVPPGQSKGDFSAGPMEAIVYNSAQYANVIHEGKGSSAKFGARPFLTDALNTFNQGGLIEATIEDEIHTALAKRGLA
jgi:hypothetical protein